MPSFHIPGVLGSYDIPQSVFWHQNYQKECLRQCWDFAKTFFWVFSMAIRNSQSEILKISDCNLCMQRPLLFLAVFELFSRFIWNLVTEINRNFKIGIENDDHRPSPSMKLHKLISITFSGRCPTVMKIPYTFYRYLTSSKYRQCHAVWKNNCLISSTSDTDKIIS